MTFVTENLTKSSKAASTGNEKCNDNCSVSEAVVCDLRSRQEPRRIDLDKLYECDPKDYIGYFADETSYDNLIQEDCDVYVGGVKVVAFRKALFPKLRDGSKGSPETWKYFRWAARDLYSDQRGLVAGRELTTQLEIRVTNGILNFFKKAMAGQVTDVEEALKIASLSPDMSKLTVRVNDVKKDFPEIEKALESIEKELRKKTLSEERKVELKEAKGRELAKWFPTWLSETWSASTDKVSEAKRADDRYVGKQYRSNKCYSNVIGAFDRGARNPYGRLTATTVKDYEGFVSHTDIYQTACSALKETLNTPENPRWDRLHERFSNVKDPHYNLFGTVFTALTLNWNFRCAMHYDGNNCEGGIAVLTAITQGEYDGHYLVFPEIRCAFDLRDGDFIAGDNQGLIHGNTAMIPKTPNAERVSFVFYSRERMTALDDMECEDCRRDFMRYAADNHKEYGKGHKTWNGVWSGMWKSPEWMSYKAEHGLERCSNTNYWGTEN
jgi:hypothetical protein